MNVTPRKQAIRPSGFSGDNIPDEIRRLIGDLITRWAYIDFQLKVIVREGFNMSNSTALTVLHGKDAVSLWPIVQTLTESEVWIADAALRTELREIAELAMAANHVTSTPKPPQASLLSFPGAAGEGPGP